MSFHIYRYLKDDRLRLTLSALLGFELEHPDNMNFNEPPFVDDDLTDDPEPTEAKVTEVQNDFSDMTIDDVKQQVI